MQAVFICDYVRTPIGRYGGSLSGIRTDDLAALPLWTLQDRHANLDWEAVIDVAYGCANQAGEDNRCVARMALLLAGLPQSVSGTTINRLCGSGLDAVLYAYRRLALGEGELAVAGGVESMSRAPLVMSKATSAFSRQTVVEDTTSGWRFVNPAMVAAFGATSMPKAAESLATELSISRVDQDRFALRSQKRVARAAAMGTFSDEIIPVAVPRSRDDQMIFETDEHPRMTTLAELSALPSVTGANGTVTIGNSSGLNDGAAALLLATESGLKQHGLTPLARITGGATAGVHPGVVGASSVAAVEKLCAQLKKSVFDFDVVEVNEYYAVQVLAILRRLGLPDDGDHVNPNGGGIALGHPLGMTGARLAGTAARTLAKGQGKHALATICSGVGQAIAMSLEST